MAGALIIAALVSARRRLFFGSCCPARPRSSTAGARRRGEVLVVVLAVVIVAAVVGDSIGFEVGRGLGPRLVRAPFLRRHPDRIGGAQAYLRRAADAPWWRAGSRRSCGR